MEGYGRENVLQQSNKFREAILKWGPREKNTERRI